MGENKEDSSEAKTTAKDIIEIIVNEVMRTASKKAGSCEITILEEIKPTPCVKKEVLFNRNMNDELLEKLQDLEIENNLLLIPHLSENCYSSFTNLSDVRIPCPILSTSSPQGEGDFQTPSYQLEVDISRSLLSRCQCHKSSSTTSLVLGALNSETFDNLHNNIYNVSFDNIDSIIKHEITDNVTKVNLENESTHASKESLNLANEFTSCDNSGYVSDSEYLALKKSNKFWHYNNMQYFSASIDQLPPNYCELVIGSNESIHLESKQNEELLERSSQTSEEFIVSVDTETDSSVPSVLPTKPSKYPIVLSSTPFPNTLNNSKTYIHSTVEDANTELVQSLEDQIEHDSVLDNEDVENDLFETRQYWSNTGLMTENKVNRKCVYSIPDSVGIESIHNVTPVKEICFKLNNQKKDLQLTSNLPSSQSNSNQGIETKVSYLSFPEKNNKKKKRRPFMTRMTNSISQIFRFKKNTQSENKN